MKRALTAAAFILVPGLALLLFCACERAAEAWIARYGDQLDKCTRVLQPDRRLGWRLRKDLHVDFIGVRVDTNEIGIRSAPLRPAGPDTFFVLVLGPSSTFGWGVDGAHTYPALLEAKLRALRPGADVRVVNAGQIGFSSWQGLAYYRNELSGLFSPDVLVIAYGVNDVDLHRFYYESRLPDKEVLGRGGQPLAGALEKFGSRFALPHLVRRYALARFAAFSGGLLGRAAGNAGGQRVSLEDFRANISALADAALARGAGVILVNTAANFPDAPPSAKGCPGAEGPGRPGACEIYGLNAKIRAVNLEMGELALRRKLPLADAACLVRAAGPTAALLDPVHFSELGNEALAEKLYNLIVGGGAFSRRGKATL